MEQKLTKKYGLFTAIAMVVGIVIGSGVFFKAQTILTATGGDLVPGILAWVFGGIIMVFCALAFSFMATKYEKVSGIVDYAEETIGKRYAYFVGWFVATIYMPSITGVLAWLSARYTIEFLNSAVGKNINSMVGLWCILLTLVYLIATYFLNVLSPKLAGKFQVSVTVIKLIPLILMGVVGIIVGLSNGTLVENFAVESIKSESRLMLFFGALTATAFAYDGWIIATSINAEIKNAKRNLPLALTIGSLIVVAICVLYNIGVAGGATVGDLANEKIGTGKAFTNIFGGRFGTILKLFVALSCLGTLNGLMLASTRTMYALAARGTGPCPKVFSRIDEKTNMPIASSVSGLLFATFWFLHFYASQLIGLLGPFGFDSSELPIITLYAFYIPIYISFMKQSKEFGIVKRFVIPILAVAGSIFMVYAAASSHSGVVYYLLTFAIFMLVGWLVDRKNKKAA